MTKSIIAYLYNIVWQSIRRYLDQLQLVTLSRVIGVIHNSRASRHGSKWQSKSFFFGSALNIMLATYGWFTIGSTTWLIILFDYWKYRYPFLTIIPDWLKGCQMDWHFWGIGHGKGPHDGAGACLKQSIWKEQVWPNSKQLHYASDVASYLEMAMNFFNGVYPLARQIVYRHFIFIGIDEVPRE